MKTQRTFCVSHEMPVVPEALFDFAIGIGDYRPSRGAHVSTLDAFWDGMRPISYGAAGNYVIPRAMERHGVATDITGIFSHRKLVVRSAIGKEAQRYSSYREISAEQSESLPVDEVRTHEDTDFLIGAPLKFPQGIVRQYAEKHRAIDLFEYLAIAVEIGVLSAQDVQDFAAETYFIPGGCELGLYPTAWLYATLRKLELLGRIFVTRCAERIRTYDDYQIRAVGFLAERVGSFLLLQEFRRRFPNGIPRKAIGQLCVIVPEGGIYSRAQVSA